MVRSVQEISGEIITVSGLELVSITQGGYVDLQSILATDAVALPYETLWVQGDISYSLISHSDTFYYVRLKRRNWELIIPKTRVIAQVVHIVFEIHLSRLLYIS